MIHSFVGHVAVQVVVAESIPPLRSSFSNFQAPPQLHNPTTIIMSASTPQTIKLSYFNLAGRGELTRLLFTFGGVAFEDDRVANFAEFKPKCPLGQMPVLEVDGVLSCQSAAIQRYAAKLGGLYPADAAAALHADMVSETLAELFSTYVSIRFHEKDEAAKAARFVKFGAENLPKVFGVLESLVKGPFFGGESASYADVHLFDVVYNAVNVSVPQFSMAAYPKLQAIVAAVKANARVTAYLAKEH